MSLTLFHSLWTVLLLVTFIGIVLWAWSGRRRAAFDAAARLPLEDGDQAMTETDPGERRNG